MPRLCLAFSLILLQVATVTAQPDSVRGRATPAPQTRLRVTIGDADPFIGTFIRVRGDSLWTGDDGPGGERFVELHSVRRLESFAGTKRLGWAGLGYGVLIGGFVGAAVATVSYTPCEQDGALGCIARPKNRVEAAGWGAIAGIAVGIPVGGLVGLIASQDRWVDMSPSALPRVALGPTARGVTLSASLRF